MYKQFVLIKRLITLSLLKIQLDILANLKRVETYIISSPTTIQMLKTSPLDLVGQGSRIQSLLPNWSTICWVCITKSVSLYTYIVWLHTTSSLGLQMDTIPCIFCLSSDLSDFLLHWLANLTFNFRKKMFLWCCYICVAFIHTVFKCQQRSFMPHSSLGFTPCWKALSWPISTPIPTEAPPHTRKRFLAPLS